MMNEVFILYYFFDVLVLVFVGNCVFGLLERSFNIVKYKDVLLYERMEILNL